MCSSRRSCGEAKVARRRTKRKHRRGLTDHKAASDIQGLVDAILEKNNPVSVASKLLKCKSAATVAKIFALLLEYRFGKPVQQIEASGPEGAQITYQFVTSAPRPNRSAGGDTEEE